MNQPAVTSEAQQRASRILDLEVHVQPVSHLEVQGTLSDFAVTDHYVAVQYRDSDDLPAYKFFDDSGNAVQPKIHPNPFTVSDLANMAKSDGRNVFSSNMNRGTYDNYYSMNDAKNALQLSDQQVQALKERLLKAFNPSGGTNYNRVDVEQGLRSDQLLFSLSTNMIQDSTLNAFAFKIGEEILVMVTESEDGQIYAPENWEIIRYDKAANIPEDDLKRLPFLHQLRGAQNAVPINGYDYGLDQERGVLNLYGVADNRKFFSAPSAGALIDPADESKLLYFDPSSMRLNEIDLDAVETATDHVPVAGRTLDIDGNVKCFRAGPQGNFLFMLIENDEDTTLQAFERKSLKHVTSIPASGDKFEIDAGGNIFFLDENGELREATTNTKTFGRGQLEEARSEERKTLLALHERVAGLKLPQVLGLENADPESLQADALVKSLSDKLTVELAPKILAAKTIDSLDQLERQILTLKRDDPEFSRYPESFDEVSVQLVEKKNQMKIDELQATVDTVMETLSAADSLEHIVPLTDEFSRMDRLRRSVLIQDSSLRRAIDAQIRDLHSLRESKFATFEAQIGPELELILEKISEDVQGSVSERELDAVGQTTEVEDFRKITSLLSSAEDRQEWRKQLRELFKERRLDIRREEQIGALSEKEDLADLLFEINELQAEITRIAESDIGNELDLDRFLREDSASQRHDSLLAMLPEEFRRVAENDFRTWSDRFKEDLRKKAQLQSTDKNGLKEVTFGVHTFPVFKAAPVNWVPRVRSTDSSSDVGVLIFEDNYGRIFETGEEVASSLEDEVTKDAITRRWDEAEAFFAETPRTLVPDYSPRWVINDHVKPTLDLISFRALQQIGKEYGGYGRGGIFILEGEAGAGKNMLYDIWCHFAGYELYEFSANVNSEKEDVTYAYEYDPAKGTVRVSSGLLEAIQRPGTMVNIDEINAFQPGVAKLFNAPFDFRRRFYLPDGRVIPIHPSVVIVGTMNPQYYLGVEKLSPEIKSRSKISELGYPALSVGNRFTGYEATILAKERAALQGFSQEEVEKAFDYVVNGNQGNGADRYVSQDVAEEIKKLHHITRIAHNVRNAYDQYQSGEPGADPIEIVFSLRETTDIAFELDFHGSVVAATKAIILPKADTRGEQKVLEAIIDNT